MTATPMENVRAETVTALHAMLARDVTTRAMVTSGSDIAGVPVPAALRDSFPTGLRTGSVYTLSGSSTVAMALLAGPTRAGSFCAAVGLPHFGVESLASWGADLTRLLLVPHPPAADWVSVVAALTEVADLIVTAQPPHVTPGEVERLHARLRTRRTTLLITGAWPRAVAHIDTATTGWTGLGQGHGALLGQQLQITVTERHRQRTQQLQWPVAA